MKIIYAIPGLGTTKELFKYLKLKETEIIYLDWPLLEKNETMRSLAIKMAGGINEEKPFYLMGVSFGGMLCVEIAKVKKPVRTILISSCKCRKEFPLFLSLFKYLPVQNFFTEGQLRTIAKNSRRLLGFERSFIGEFHEMIDSMKKNYFTRSINCIVNWKETNCLRPDIIHIHGTSDRLIGYRNVKCDHSIKKGSHAMIVNKAEEISKILNENLKA